MRQAFLHREGLLRALTEVALEVQKAGTVDEVLRIAGAALETMGFVAMLLEVEVQGEQFSVRHASGGPLAEQLVKALKLTPGSAQRFQLPPDLRRAAEPQKATLITGLVERFRHSEVFREQGAAAAALLEQHRLDSAALAPLNVRNEGWGVLFVAHADLSEEDLPPLHLFGLQLGSAIEVAETIERLDRLTVEMALAQQLAVAGPNADARALCMRALSTVCVATRSDAGALHRYNAATGTFDLVAEPYGEVGGAIEGFRSFALAPGGFQEVASIPVGQLPERAAAVRVAGFSHLCVLPLVIERQPVGLLTLARRQDVAYTARDLRSAEALGVQMSSLLERTGLYEEAKRLYADLKRSYDDLARAQAELVRHERLAALGELAAVMAHEVRNPLGVIFNSLSTLKRLLHPQGDAEMLLNMVGEEADRLNRIVGDLLDFVRPYEPAKHRVAVAPIIASAVDVASQSVAHGSKVVVELPQELPPFPVDGQLLRQALVNLVINALQAMPRGGQVFVEAHMETKLALPWLVINVRDEGVGIHPTAAEKMFQPFFTTKATGTGLGLAVVKRIVEAHQGEVSARPNGERGTIFTVRLPGSEPRENVTTPPRAVASAPRAAGQSR